MENFLAPTTNATGEQAVEMWCVLFQLIYLTFDEPTLTRSKGSVNLPQGFLGLTMIYKDFQGMNEINYFCQKISSQSWQKISLQN